MSQIIQQVVESTSQPHRGVDRAMGRTFVSGCVQWLTARASAACRGVAVSAVAAAMLVGFTPLTGFAQGDKPAAEPAKDAKDAAKPDAKSDAKKPKDTLANRQITGRATRVAFLDFGPPPTWKGMVDDMVGVTISAKAFRDVLPMLDADKVDVVVVKINSGGGYGLETNRFQELFENTYEKKYRTVAWVHSAISAAAMGPWSLDEFYMEPEGNIGACTGWSGALVAVKGVNLLQMLQQMEGVSKMGGRDPKIMRSMQIMEPLSFNADEFGNVEFFQDSTSGKILLNPDGQVLTLNAVDAMRCKFARGIAANEAELMKTMGITEYEVVGQKATKYIQDYMRKAHKIDKEIGEVAVQYRISFGAALQLQGEDNREARNIEIGKCRAALAKLKKQVEVNPNFEFHLAQGFGAELTKEWFEENDRVLRRLAQGERR